MGTVLSAIVNHWFKVVAIAMLVAIYAEVRDTNGLADQARRHAIAAEEQCARR